MVRTSAETWPAPRTRYSRNQRMRRKMSPALARSDIMPRSGFSEGLRSFDSKPPVQFSAMLTPAMSEEQAIPAVPEPDDPAFADLEPSFCKFVRSVTVPLVAHGRHKLLCYEPFDRLLWIRGDELRGTEH